MAKASLPSGFRDFNPEEFRQRENIFNTIKKVYNLYGFQPIETPSVENIETLTEKYGEEGDQLLFRIIKSGDFLKKLTDQDLQNRDTRKILNAICDKGLRYDLTVPFARFVAMNKNDIVFPFKRYQIQKVWRADRPQKGRYREFYQCDADVIGSSSLIFEAEFLMIQDRVFDELNLDNITIKINHRKILQGLAEKYNLQDRFNELTIVLDKLDKIGWEGLEQEFANRDFDKALLLDLQNFSNLNDPEDTLNNLSDILTNSEVGLAGVNDLKQIMSYLEEIDLLAIDLIIDPTLARGLNYYTGTILETVPASGGFGSIAGGGRYDNLTSYFGLPGVSGTGFTFGIERIFDLMKERNLFENKRKSETTVLLINFGEKFEKELYKVAHEFRLNDISTELHPSGKNIGKQFKYADKRNIPFVLSIGEEELDTGKYTLKNMITGDQETVSFDEVIMILQNT